MPFAASSDRRADLWRQLADLVTPDAGLRDVLLLAHASQKPSSAERPTRDGTDPWLTLVDWLVENDLGHVFEAGDRAAELAWGLSNMAPVLVSGADLQSVDDAELSLTLGILRANALLGPVGLELVVFDTGSESGPVVVGVVAAANTASISELAAELGHRLDTRTAE